VLPGGPDGARPEPGDGACFQVCAGQRVTRTLSLRQGGQEPAGTDSYGQRRPREPGLAVFAQVRGHMEVQGAVCKTVGSAYVGSKPTPATQARTALDL